VVVLVAITLNFLLPRLMPGSPLRYLAGEDVGLLTPAERLQLLHDAGLDRPLWEQYGTYVGGLLKGDLGYSFQRHRAVSQLLLDRLPWTLLLTGSALVIATVVGTSAGAAAAWRHGRRADLTLVSVFVVLESLPAFWCGMLLVSVFAVQAHLFPSFGAYTALSQLDGPARWLDVIKHLVLPLTTLVLVSISGMFLTTRSSLTSVLGEDYIRVAQSKGLSQSRVLFGHAMRNALAPVVTVFVLNLGQLVAGATVVETVFSYPGLGQLVYEAAVGRDYPVLQGALLLIALSVLVTTFAVDMVYSRLDPRITVAA
jgi:peptide/nickel transport system permease protein